MDLKINDNMKAITFETKLLFSSSIYAKKPMFYSLFPICKYYKSFSELDFF